AKTIYVRRPGPTQRQPPMGTLAPPRSRTACTSRGLTSRTALTTYLGSQGRRRYLLRGPAQLHQYEPPSSTTTILATEPERLKRRSAQTVPADAANVQAGCPHISS